MLDKMFTLDIRLLIYKYVNPKSLPIRSRNHVKSEFPPCVFLSRKVISAIPILILSKLGIQVQNFRYGKQHSKSGLNPRYGRWEFSRLTQKMMPVAKKNGYMSTLEGFGHAANGFMQHLGSSNILRIMRYNTLNCL